jgi:hypothetical protein
MALELIKTADDQFELLGSELPSLQVAAEKSGPIAYFAEESMRFYSIAGSLRDSGFLEQRRAEDRYIVHILGRSLLEGFFWIVYIFDHAGDRQSRYVEKVNDFRYEYSKFWNENHIPGRPHMEPADPSWRNLVKSNNIKNMLDKAKNDEGNSLSNLYFLYRVATFDTHGNTMSSLFESAFENTSCNFSVLNFKAAFELIANTYYCLVQELRTRGDI